MIIVLSPSKTLDYETEPQTTTYTQPEFLADAETLVDILREFSVEELGELMDISENLSELNWQRYQDWSTPFDPDNAKQALLAFKGDVYTDFRLDAYGEDDFRFAQKHIRTLSGLYGVLRPLDLMQPYRLEMGTRLVNPRGPNLYAYWGDRIAKKLGEALDAQGDDVLLNLASNEYFKSVQTDALGGRVVDVRFLENKSGDYKIISFYAKRARGTMSDWIVRNRITDVEDVSGFDEDGYYFDPERTTDDEFVFLRDGKSAP